MQNLITEFEWVQQRLSEESELGHSSATKMIGLLKIAWNRPDVSFWEIGKVVFPKLR